MPDTASLVPKNHVDGTITLRDGGSLSLTVPYDAGKFSIKKLNKGVQEESTYYARDKIVGRRRNKQAIPTLSLQAMFADLRLANAIMRQGDWAAAVSTLPAGADADCMTFEVEIVINGAAHGDANDYSVIAKKVALVIDDIAEGDPNMITLSGEILIFNGDLTDLVIEEV
jgi:hypothetical protein